MNNGINVKENSELIAKGIANLKQILESNGANHESATDIINRYDSRWDEFLEKTTFKDMEGNELSPESVVMEAKHNSPDYFNFSTDNSTEAQQNLSGSTAQHVLDKMTEGYEPNENELKTALKNIFSRKIKTVQDQANFMKSYCLCRKHMKFISNWSFLKA